MSQDETRAEQPDPTKSVADEIERREKTGPPDNKTPDVTTRSSEPSSASEAQSDKPWSRSAGEVQEREFEREGTSPSESEPPQG